MLKNEQLIYKMSPRQRIRFLIGNSDYTNCSMGEYAFPVFCLKENPLAGEGVYTCFPSERALAGTFDPALVNSVFKCVGEEAKSLPLSYYNITNNLTRQNVTEDYYLSGRYYAQKIKGLTASGALVNFENYPEGGLTTQKERVHLIDELVFAEAAPSSCLSADTEFLNNGREGKQTLLFGKAASKEQAAKLLIAGCCLIYPEEPLSKEQTEEWVDYLSDLTECYRDALQTNCSDEELDDMQRAGRVLAPAFVDGACDHLISLLVELGYEGGSGESRSLLIKDGHTPQFDEVEHDRIALRAARESVVLLKNDNRMLPLDPRTKVAVIGEYAHNLDYRQEISPHAQTAQRLPFELINDFDMTAVGYAHGYKKGEYGRQDLVATALQLCAEADCALVYLCTENGSPTLPYGQIELLYTLAQNGVRIIAVVSSDVIPDFSFADFCGAVLFTCRGGQQEDTAVLEILTGAVNPSGRLTYPVAYNEQGSPVNEVPRYCTEGGHWRYPFGYGLSYTTFSYSNLKITEAGVSCTVTNTGEYDGDTVVQMYVQNLLADGSLHNRVLRGFARVSIKKHDGVKVEIPFDKNTFASYYEKKDCYRVEGGNYRVSLGDNAAEERLYGELTLAEYRFRTEGKSEVIGQSDDAQEALADFLPEPQKKGGWPFGLKLFLALLLAVYFNAMSVLLLIGNFAEGSDIVFPIVIGVFMAAVDIGIAVFIVKICKSRKKNALTADPNDVLTQLVENISDFQQTAKVSYVTPVQIPQEEEQSVVEEPLSDEVQDQAEEEQEDTYENRFADIEEERIVFKEQISMNELCTNFHDFALSRGVDVDVQSARALFAAICSSKLVLLDVRNRDVLPDFLAALTAYFHCGGAVNAQNGWQSRADFLWERSEGKLVASEFVNNVYAAAANRDKTCIALLAEANPENLPAYFTDFLGYALFPSEEHILKMNEELSLRLPDNVCYLVSLAEGCSTDALPAEYARAAVLLQPVVGRAEAGAAVEIKPVSYTRLQELVTEARAQKFLSERLWKKIDELVETVGLTENFRIDNKNILQIERLTSLVMECGGDEAEALTIAFTAKIVPLIKRTTLYRKEDGEKTAFGLIEKLFTDEDLTKIERALVKYVPNAEEGPAAMSAEQSAEKSAGQTEDKQISLAEQSAEQEEGNE